MLFFRRRRRRRCCWSFIWFISPASICVNVYCIRAYPQCLFPTIFNSLSYLFVFHFSQLLFFFFYALAYVCLNSVAPSIIPSPLFSRLGVKPNFNFVWLSGGIAEWYSLKVQTYYISHLLLYLFIEMEFSVYRCWCYCCCCCYDLDPYA